MHEVCGSDDALCRVQACLGLSFLETSSETESCVQSLLGSALGSYTCREVREAELDRQERNM